MDDWIGEDSVYAVCVCVLVVCVCTHACVCVFVCAYASLFCRDRWLIEYRAEGGGGGVAE